MKQQIFRFAPWIALMILGVVGTSQPANTTPPPQERHPHIRAAVGELREANEELRTAAHDFCGHRVEAMRAIEARPPAASVGARLRSPVAGPPFAGNRRTFAELHGISVAAGRSV